LIVDYSGDFDNGLPPESDNWKRGRRFSDENKYCDEQIDATVDLVVCHFGSLDESTLKLILDKRPNAKILVLSNGGPTLEYVQKYKAYLTEKEGQRIFGCTQRESIREAFSNWGELINFFANNEATPAIESFLGLDFPIRKLALQVALEIVRYELASRHSSDRKSRVEPPDKNVRILLEPALQVSDNNQTLEGVMEPVRQAIEINASSDVLLTEIELACSKLCEQTHAVREQ
jgi:hypothetical protein